MPAAGILEAVIIRLRLLVGRGFACFADSIVQPSVQLCEFSVSV